MGCELIVVARTDALSAKHIDSSADPIDQPFIMGESPDGKRRTFPEAGLQAISKFFEGQ